MKNKTADSYGRREALILRSAQIPAPRQCAYCGVFVSSYDTQCPECRETLPEIAKVEIATPPAKPGQIRQGLLYMLLAAVIHYFAAGYSAMSLPFPINPMVTVCLSPLLFLSGLGLVLYGFYLRNFAR